MEGSRPEHVPENAGSLDFALTPEQRQRLDAVGAPPRLNPCFIFDLPDESIFGVRSVEKWR